MVVRFALCSLTPTIGSIAHEVVVHRNMTVHVEASLFELSANYNEFLKTIGPKARFEVLLSSEGEFPP